MNELIRGCIGLRYNDKRSERRKNFSSYIPLRNFPKRYYKRRM